MNERKEVLSFMIYMWNAWTINECAYVFNGYDNVGASNWEYSLGEHIWNKWKSICEYYGVFGAAERLVAELDENNLNKLVNRACELYCGRQNKC